MLVQSRAILTQYWLQGEEKGAAKWSPNGRRVGLYHVMYDMINALFIRHTHAPDCSHTLRDIIRLMDHLQQLRAGVLELAGWVSSRSE